MEHFTKLVVDKPILLGITVLLYIFQHVTLQDWAAVATIAAALSTVILNIFKARKK